MTQVETHPEKNAETPAEGDRRCDGPSAAVGRDPRPGFCLAFCLVCRNTFWRADRRRRFECCGGRCCLPRPASGVRGAPGSFVASDPAARTRYPRYSDSFRHGKVRRLHRPDGGLEYRHCERLSRDGRNAGAHQEPHARACSPRRRRRWSRRHRGRSARRVGSTSPRIPKVQERRVAAGRPIGAGPRRLSARRIGAGFGGSDPSRANGRVSSTRRFPRSALPREGQSRSRDRRRAILDCGSHPAAQHPSRVAGAGTIRRPLRGGPKPRRTRADVPGAP